MEELARALLFDPFLIWNAVRIRFRPVGCREPAQAAVTRIGFPDVSAVGRDDSGVVRFFEVSGQAIAQSGADFLERGVGSEVVDAGWIFADVEQFFGRTTVDGQVEERADHRVFAVLNEERQRGARIDVVIAAVHRAQHFVDDLVLIPVLGAAEFLRRPRWPAFGTEVADVKEVSGANAALRIAQRIEPRRRMTLATGEDCVTGFVDDPLLC